MTMIDTEARTLVFKDQAGDYFLVPQETFERGRVPDERKAELERLVAQATAPADGDGEVQGFLLQLFAGAALAGLGVLIGHSAATHDPKANREWIEKTFGVTGGDFGFPTKS